MPSAASLLYSVGLLVTLAAAHPVVAQQIPFTRELLIDANEHDLSQMWFVAAFRDGTIVVSQPQDGRIVYFSREGRRLANVGRSGSGPGEFGHVGGIPMFVGDTLLVLDGPNARHHLFDSRGKLVRTSRLPDLSLPGHPGTFLGAGKYIWGQEPGGGMLIRSYLQGAAPPAWRIGVGQHGNGTRVTIRADKDGTITTLVAVEPSSENECSLVVSMRIECPSTLFAYGNDARIYANASTTFGGARSSYITVRSITGRGDTTFTRRVPFTPEPITSRFIDSIANEVSDDPARVVAWRNRPYREWLAPIKQLLVASDDAVWIGFRPSASGRKWLILNADGTTRGTMTVPSGVYITAASASHFWGMLEDEDGLDHPVRYRMGSPGQR